MAKKCPTCGSRKWRKDGVTGSVICEEGHVLAGVRSENLVMEPTGHAMQKRRMLKGDRVNKRKTEGQANKDYIHGEAAEYLRLQGLQLMLRHQVAALKKLWSLPDALELVVRDLWTYQLLITPVPTPDEESRPGTPVPEAGPSGPSGAFIEQQYKAKTRKDGSKSRPGSRSESGSGSDTETSNHGDSGDKSGEDAGLEAELSEVTDDEEESGQGEASDSWKPRKRQLKASDTLVTLITALWVLRVPFTYALIERLVNTNQIPYIDFSQTTLVPAEMAKRMNRAVNSSLRPQRSPVPEYLFESTRRFGRFLTTFGQVIPEINLPPVAWHVVSQLGGNAITYSQVVAFLELIDANMFLNPETQLVMQKRRSSMGETTDELGVKPARMYDNFMPEQSVAAAFVIVMKLAYGLDGVDRLALLRTDPLIGLPQPTPWLDELERRVKSGELTGSQQELGPQRFDLMEPADIDRFLDRCEDVLLKNRHHGSGGNLFPLPPATDIPARDPPLNSWTAFHASVQPITLAAPVPSSTRNKALPLMPGESYRSYAAADVTGTLPQDFELVLTAAGQVVGLSTQVMARTVEAFERRMETLRPRRENAHNPALRRVHAASGLRESKSFG